MKDLIYLDHSAATPMDPQVVASMAPYFSDLFYNPSAPYAPAVQVKRDYKEAKSKIATQLGVVGDEIVITAGATESVNLAFGAVGQGKVLVASIEHASVLRAADREGKAVIVEPNQKGRISAESVKNALTPDVSFVSIAYANHDLGAIQPIEEIAQVIASERERRRENGEDLPILFHTDASQAGVLVDLKIKRLGVDLLTLSAAKVYGPKQVGLLWVRPGVKLSANIVGGGQEGGLRSGTENVAGVIGFAKALEVAAKKRPAEVKRLKAMRDRLASGLKDNFPDIKINTDLKKSLVNYLNVSFAGVDAERLVFLLENQGVMVATGSSCAANAGNRSHVLEKIGLSDAEIDGSLRISLGRLNTDETVDLAIENITKAINQELARIG